MSEQLDRFKTLNVEGKQLSTRTAPWVKALILSLSMLLIALLSWHHLSLGNNAITLKASSDFHKFYLSAKRLDEGWSMYWIVPPRLKAGDPCHADTPIPQRATNEQPGPLTLGGEIPCLGPNLNPPVFMLLMQPLARLPYKLAWWIWAGLSIVCLAWTAWSVSAFTSPSSRINCLPWLAAMLAFSPGMANFELGQLGWLLTLMLARSWLALRRGHTSAAGLWLGAAIALKPFLAPFLLGLWLIKEPRALRTTLATTTVLTLLGVIAFGAQASFDYLAMARHVSWTATNWNGSWTGFFDRVFIGLPQSNWPANQSLSRTLAAAFSLITLGITIWILRRHERGSHEPSDSADTLFATMTPAALLISPLGWLYYFPALILSFVISHKQTRQTPGSELWKLAPALPVALAMIPVPLSPSATPMHPANLFGLDSLAWLTLLATHATAVAIQIRRETASKLPE